MENAVTSRDTRKGSKILRQFLWDRMSPAAQLANSTRELNKLSEEEQEQARKPNAGKHAANAGGWAKSQNQAEEKASAQASAKEEGSTIPNKRRKVREPDPSTSWFPSIPSPEAVFENTLLDPLLRSQSEFHGHDRPLSSFNNPYDILPTEVASGPSNTYPQFHLFPNGQYSSSGVNSVRRYEGELPSSWYNSQPTLPATQGQATHPPLWVEGDLDNTQDFFSSQYIDPRVLMTVQHHNTHPRIDVEGPLGNPSGGIHAQHKSFEGHVEAYLLGTGLRSLENQTQPMENQPSEEIDYRNIRPRSREDEQHIQRALAITRDNCRLRSGTECPPTTRDQSYSYQLRELLYNFTTLWGDSSYLPDIVSSREPWRNGFANWVPCSGRDKDFIFGRFEGTDSYR